MKKLLLALPFLLAACQSERVAFRFQPVTPAASAAPRVEATSTAATPASLPRAVVAAETPVIAPTTTERQATTKRKRLPAAQIATPAELPLSALATTADAPATTPRTVARLLPKRLLRQHATAGPAHTAESGLGGIALFFIAVVLGLLAGLGALVSLIPGISFFGGVGLAAAGLLVLFLLYSLLSGGKKKRKPAK